MNDAGLDLRGLLGLLRRRSWIIISTVVGALTLCAVVLLAVSPIYQATTLVLVDTNRKDLLDPSGTISNSGGDNARVESEVEIVATDNVLVDVIEQHNLIADHEFGAQPGLVATWLDRLKIKPLVTSEREQIGVVLDKLKKAISVERRGLTYLIAIQSRSRSPERSALLANAVAQAYIRSQIEAKVKSAVDASGIVSSQLGDAEKNIADGGRRLDDFIIQNADQIATATGSADIAQAARELGRVVDERDRASNVLRSASESVTAGDWAQVANQLNSTQIAELAQQRVSLQASLQSTSDTAIATQMRSELNEVQTRLQSLAEEQLNALRVSVTQADQNATNFRTQFQTDVATGGVSGLSSELESDLYRIVNESSIARRNYQTLLERSNNLATEARLQRPDSRVVSVALPPNVAAFPNSKFIFALTAIASLGLGMGLAFVVENYVGGFTDQMQTEAVLKMRLATVVPKHAPRTGTLSLSESITDEPLSAYAEAFRRLRVSIDNTLMNYPSATEGEAGKVVMVTSAYPSEGKTTVALSLARNYAMAGLTVLLVDCDMRRPSLHKHFNVDVDVGLNDYLRETGSNQVSFAKDPKSSVRAIFSARRDSLPTDHLLNGKRFRQLIASATQKFDLIIMDTPPIGPVVDGLYMASIADVIVCVIQAAHTPQRAVVETIERLRDATREQVPILAMLNQMQTIDVGSSFNSYYTS